MTKCKHYDDCITRDTFKEAIKPDPIDYKRKMPFYMASKNLKTLKCTEDYGSCPTYEFLRGFDKLCKNATELHISNDEKDNKLKTLKSLVNDCI